MRAPMTAIWKPAGDSSFASSIIVSVTASPASCMIRRSRSQILRVWPSVDEQSNRTRFIDSGSAEGLGPFEQLLQAGLVRIGWLAGMDDRDLTTLGVLHQLPVGPRRDVLEVRLLAFVIGEHPIVDQLAFVATRAACRLDP